MKAWSLFSGVGGMDHGLAVAGITHTLFAESDAWRRSVLAAHFPGVPIVDDVRSVSGERGAADLICGGFPCQDLSVAGQRRGLAGDRSGLFFEFARILDAVRPRWVLLENVPGLLSSNDGRDMGTVVGTLADLGYGVGWRVLDARHFGVPQRRRRVFIVGRLGDDGRSALRCLCESCEGSAETRDCSWQEPAARAGRGAPGDGPSYYVEDHVNGTLRANGAGDGPPRTDKQPMVVEQGVSHPLLGHHKRDDPNGPTHALGRTSIGMGVASAVRVRRLTPVECERLMGWPDGFTAPPGIKAPDSKRYAACGDGVVANVSEWIGRRLLVEDARCS